MARLGLVVLLLLLALIQYPLWIGHGGWFHLRALEAQVQDQRSQNGLDAQNNAQLAVEVQELRYSMAALEERARRDMGMVKEGEFFVQFVFPTPAELPPAPGRSVTQQTGRVSNAPARMVPEPRRAR